jgi:hypothetical protein
MYCRVTSVTGMNIVLPGTFDTYRLPLAYAGNRRGKSVRPSLILTLHRSA